MAHLLLRDVASQAKAAAQDQSRQVHLVLQDLASQAKAVLGRSRIFDLRCLEVEQFDEYVVLRGRVDSYYHKQLAQELLKTHIDGVEVINEIDVN
jgi:hypothetical protein